MNSAPAQLEQSFTDHCLMQYNVFANKYEHLFQPGFREGLMQQTTPANGLIYINNEASFLGLRLYLIIDEYDNFTNTILSSFGTSSYRQATHGEGFFRYFFNVIKAATSDNRTALERIFITGVSPITLDDVTSGFNIGTNITTRASMNNIVGFSEAELCRMLNYYQSEGMLHHTTDQLIALMKPWYDNYRFAENALSER